MKSDTYLAHPIEPQRVWACMLPLDGSFFWLLC
ncbi:hypothetical protein DFO68_106174 [Halomonas ventosae]|uniref:Uncharacterized protein n=1 Tax=Halomonas ventosae TaxID=229007 RepID=A0A4R6HNM7_9GAMM|nr:hypothetical protein DFO68_106174 [Halomonas ventosae]